MKHALTALLSVILLAGIPTLLIGSAEPETAAPLVTCEDTKIGNKIKVVCEAAGVVVLDTTIDPSVVTLPPIEIPGPTIRIPGPTETRFVRGPTTTRTVTQTQQAPEQTRTITAAPETVTQSASPQAPVTETVTASPEPPRQTGTEDDTMGDTEDDPAITIPETDLSTPEVVGLGTLAILIIAALIVLGMWAGYYMGYKDSDKVEAKFLKSLLSKK